MKTLLKNGKIYDGTGKDAFVGSILIEDNKIIKVFPDDDPSEANADYTVDLNGLSVSSGFIDGHSHNDWFAIKNDPLPYFDPFIRQGITTFVTGNCGISEIGFDKDCEYVDKMGGGLFGFRNTKGEYGNISEYFEATDRKMPCNMAVLVGHCSARAAVSGYANRKLSSDEEDKMLAIIEENLKQGAAGVSLGLMYEPGLYADVEELKKVAALCVKYDKPLTVHPRANSAVSMAYPELFGRSHILRAVDELVEIAKGTKLKLHYSHAIFVGKRSLKDKDEFVQIMSDLRKDGVDAMFDIYNECLGVSVITVILPTWYQGMSLEERKKPINRIKLSILIKATSALLGFGFDDIQIAYIGKGYEKYEGKTVHEIAKEENMKDLDAYLMLCEKSDFCGRVNMGPYSTPEIISDFEKNEFCLYMTDGWVEEHGIQNPVIYDCYPKFIRDSLLGTGCSMPMTIRKMTGAISDRFSLKERGYLKEGYYADLTVFDEDEIKAATPDQGKPFGIKKVYINGQLVLEDGQLSAEKLKTTGMALSVN
ncbi:MAG: amidohydrolase family protein [Lachnospiraceae bacterium]|nr:amidohydrolase family protein [Lachnospiraceae bacterium]